MHDNKDYGREFSLHFYEMFNNYFEKIVLLN